MYTFKPEDADMLHDISYYSNDGRLTEPSNGTQYEWRKMIDESQKLGRPLTDNEADIFKKTKQ